MTQSKPSSEKRHLFDDPRNVKRTIGLLIVACALVFGLDAVVHRHIDNPAEALFGFYAAYGFVACVILVLVAKEMRKVIMRKDDYYDG